MPGQPPPPPPPPPPPVVTERGIWEPGGNPGELRRAAGAWRAMAATLRTVSTTVGPAVTTTRATWKGDASDAFAAWWGDIDAGVVGAAEMFDEVAGQLDEIAAEVERINDEIRDLLVALTATLAVSVAASFITFGASAAAGAALAARSALTAASLVRTLGMFLRGIRVSFTAFRLTRFAGFWRTWTIAAGTNTAMTGAFKLVMEGQNPFDGDSWTRHDVTGIVVGSTLGVGVAKAIPGVAAAHPFATGFGTGATGSVISDLWIHDRPLGFDTVRNALVNGTVSGGGAALQRGILDRWGGAPRTTGPMDHDPAEIVVPLRPVPGDPADLVVPRRPTPGDPASLLVPGRPVPGDPASLVVPGRPVPGDPADLVVPGRPTAGDPAGLIVPGARPAPLEGPVRIFLPNEPAPRPIVAPPLTPLQHLRPGEPQKTAVRIPVDFAGRVAKEPFLAKPTPITPAGAVAAPDFGPWPAPPPADQVLVGAP